LLGHPDQALKRSYETLALAQELAHPYSLTSALHYAAIVHQLRREGRAAQERAEAAVTVSTGQGLAFWLGATTLPLGWALAEQGRGGEGITRICQGKRAAAHQLLAEVYSWFTEGFDTVDLQEAKALLKALS
jgi:predicted ATPase